MRRFVLMLIVIFLIALPAAAQEAPPQINIALARLSEALGRQISLVDLDRYAFRQDFFTDSALGCPLVAGTALSSPVSAYTFDLTYQEITYNVRVSFDGANAFVCENALLTLPTADPNSNCPPDFAGYLAPRLRVGGQGRLGTGGTPNRLRTAPSVNAEQIGLIEPGSTVNVIGGPSCEDTSRIVWWRVAYDNTIGWTAEGQLPNNYFLASVGAAPLGTLPLERSLINTNTINALAPLADAAFSGARAVAFTQNGQALLVAGDDGAALYNLLDGSSTVITDDAVTTAAISADGRSALYATLDNAVYLRDLQAAPDAEPALISPQGDVVNALAFGADGGTYAIGRGDPVLSPVSRPAIELFVTGQLPQVTLTEAPVRALAFAPPTNPPTGERLAYIDDAVRLLTFNADPQIVAALAQTNLTNAAITWFNPNVILFSDGAALRAENISTRITQTYSGDATEAALAASVNRDETLIAALLTTGGQARLAIFFAETGDLLFAESYADAVAIAFSPDGTLIALAGANGVTLIGVDVGGIAVG